MVYNYINTLLLFSMLHLLQFQTIGSCGTVILLGHGLNAKDVYPSNSHLLCRIPRHLPDLYGGVQVSPLPMRGAQVSSRLMRGAQVSPRLVRGVQVSPRLVRGAQVSPRLVRGAQASPRLVRGAQVSGVGRIPETNWFYHDEITADSRANQTTR